MIRAAWHVVAIGLVLAGLVWSCTFVRRQSRIAGWLFVTGLVVRAVGALSFFLISYLQLPVMRSQQLGDGFWKLAPDALEYYRYAREVSEHWHIGLPVHSLAPGFIGPMALWMQAVGVHPASPALFSLAMHAVGVVVFVAAFGRARPRESQMAMNIGVAALSCSPMLIFAAVFGLKDVFVTTLVIVFVVACLLLVTTAWTHATARDAALAAVAGIVAVWLVAGIRSYFAILMLSAVSVACVAGLIVRRGSRVRRAVQAFVILSVLGVIITAGAETVYPDVVAQIVASLPGAVVARRPPLLHGGLDELDTRRDAITAYGGASVFNRASDRFGGLGIGLAAVCVPLTILEALSVMDIHLRIDARAMADADTVFLDASAVVVLWLLVVNRRRLNPVPMVLGIAMAVLVALPLAYVMTNYGTLIRLRLMAAVPLWLATLALAPRFTAGGSGPVEDSTGASAPATLA